MESKKTNIPKRRFAGFSDAWEQRKFGDVGSVSMCKRIFKNETSDVGDIPFYKIGTFGGEPDAYISRELFDEYREKFSYPDAGDVLLSASGTIGRIVEFKGEEAYFQDSNIVWLSHDKSISNKFLKVLYPTVKWDGIEGSTIKRLYNDNFLKTQFMMPKVEEQERIGEYFEQLDNLITLHQRKLDKLKDMKKSYLSEMFPQPGEKKPRRRFKGFTEDWEQRKFRDTFDFMQNNALSRADLSSAGGDVMNVHYGDVLVKYGEVLDVKKDEMTYLLDASLVTKYLASLLQNGDIIIADAAEDETVGKCSEIAGLTDEKVLSGLHTIPCRPRENFAEGYLGYYMNSGSYHDQLLPLIQGTKVSSISKSAIQDTDIMYPKSETEQRQIGDYFRNLDHLITLHQRKLDKLKNIKQAYLNEMFVK